GRSNSGKNNPTYGRHRTKEEKEHHSKIMKGRFSGENNPMYGKRTKAMKGKHHTEESNLKNSIDHKDRVHVRNETITKFIKQSELEKYIKLGFRKGRIYTRSLKVT